MFPACSDGVKDLISRILVQDPGMRPSLHVRLTAVRCGHHTSSQMSAPISQRSVRACSSSCHSSPCFLLQDIQAHPWFMQGLEPGALNFNDAIVQESLANQPTAGMLAEV